MDAGRELDRLVAERVMGFTMYHYDKDYKENQYYMLMDGDFHPVVEFPFRAGERKTEAAAWDDTPHYSTDIAAAWQVVQRMRVLGYRATVQTWVNTADAMVMFYKPEDTYKPDRHIGATDDTAPLAICRAALRAIGVDLGVP